MIMHNLLKKNDKHVLPTYMTNNIIGIITKWLVNATRDNKWDSSVIHCKVRHAALKDCTTCT